MYASGNICKRFLIYISSWFNWYSEASASEYQWNQEEIGGSIRLSITMSHLDEKGVGVFKWTVYKKVIIHWIGSHIINMLFHKGMLMKIAKNESYCDGTN